MASTHLSIRISTETMKKLDAESRAAGRTRSDFAKTLIEEGLRMEAHPGIVFRPGPAGRRPGLAAGPDVWEVMNTFLDSGQTGEQAIKEVADYLDLHPRQVKTAVGYYADYKEEIDEWIRLNDEEAEEAEARWRREQDVLAR